MNLYYWSFPFKATAGLHIRTQVFGVEQPDYVRIFCHQKKNEIL